MDLVYFPRNLLINYPRTTRFESATIILPVMNETTALDETVKIILRDVEDKIKEIVIVVCKRTTSEAMAVVNRLQARTAGTGRGP